MKSSSSAGSDGLGRYLSPLSAWALSFGCAVGWGAFIIPGTTFLPLAGPLGTLIGLGIGAAVMFLGYGLYNFALSGMPAGQATAFMNLVPVCSLFMGVFFLNETMTLMQYGAAALVIGGVVLTQMPAKDGTEKEDGHA